MVPKPLLVKWERAVIHISFAMGQEIFVETLSIFYTINNNFIIRDYR